VEICFEEFANGGEVVLHGIGRLSIEVQAITVGAALTVHARLTWM
jgi:hypothetical protein